MKDQRHGRCESFKYSSDVLRTELCAAAPNCVRRHRTACCGPNCVLNHVLRRGTCYGTEYDSVLRHAAGLTSDATRRRVAEEHADEVTSDATRRRVAEEHADEVTPDAARRRVAEEHAGLRD